MLGVGSGVNDPNVAATLLRHGNYDYVTNSVMWDPAIAEHNLPDSLYLSRLPEWWCQETPWPAIGPDVAGYANKIPATAAVRGAALHPDGGADPERRPGGSSTIYLTWEVMGTLPVTSTWKISYVGPPGDQPSPVSGLPAGHRAYTLSGVTNYAPYHITLNALLEGTPILTDTLTVLPSDILLRLPAVMRGP